MIEVRPFSSLGGGNHGWLDGKHQIPVVDREDPNEDRPRDPLATD